MNEKMLEEIVNAYVYEKEVDHDYNWEMLFGTVYINSTDHAIDASLVDDARLDRVLKAASLKTDILNPLMDALAESLDANGEGYAFAEDMFAGWPGPSIVSRLENEAVRKNNWFETLQCHVDSLTATEKLAHLSTTKRHGTLGELQSCYLLVMQWPLKKPEYAVVDVINLGVHIRDSLVGTNND